jgi:glutamate synthase domain-containing protein 3
MVTSSASSQAVVVKGLVDASTPLSATVAGNTAQFTVASGALRVQRTAGSVGLLAYAVVVYR